MAADTATRLPTSDELREATTALLDALDQFDAVTANVEGFADKPPHSVDFDQLGELLAWCLDQHDNFEFLAEDLRKIERAVAAKLSVHARMTQMDADSTRDLRAEAFRRFALEEGGDDAG